MALTNPCGRGAVGSSNHPRRAPAKPWAEYTLVAILVFCPPRWRNEPRPLSRRAARRRGHSALRLSPLKRHSEGPANLTAHSRPKSPHFASSATDRDACAAELDGAARPRRGSWWSGTVLELPALARGLGEFAVMRPRRRSIPPQRRGS